MCVRPEVSPAGCTAALPLSAYQPGESTLGIGGFQARAITAVSPASGSQNGGDRVTLTGSNFENGARVFFGKAEERTFSSLPAHRSASPRLSVRAFTRGAALLRRPERTRREQRLRRSVGSGHAPLKRLIRVLDTHLAAL
ncbi:MAG: IPT/TIG domain-containing protein [Myxococcaceae bacterium]